MPTKEWNVEMWGQNHSWVADGDEFHQFATARGQDYRLWKDGLVREFLLPHVSHSIAALEIGCGHGRWSSFLVGAVRKLYLIDIAPPCIEACRAKFGDGGATYILSGGDLGAIPDASIDFVWSFDVLVHVEPEDINTYVREIDRVLKVGGIAILHHADNHDRGGSRSAMTAGRMRAFAETTRLAVVSQRDSWGDAYQYSVAVHGDVISTLAKPANIE